MLIAAPFVMIVCVWLYTMIFTFSALWFTHYALTELERLRVAEAKMTAVRPATPAGAPLQVVEEVPPHERRSPVDGTDPADPLAGPLP
jgi:hypothetical protein